MKASAFRVLINNCIGVFKRHAPIDTGNLRYNSIKSEQYSAFGTKAANIYIEDEIAPYVYYTNEPWISPRWHGRKNPNEGWIDRAVAKIAEHIASEVGGEVRIE